MHRSWRVMGYGLTSCLFGMTVSIFVMTVLYDNFGVHITNEFSYKIWLYVGVITAAAGTIIGVVMDVKAKKERYYYTDKEYFMRVLKEVGVLLAVNAVTWLLYAITDRYYDDVHFPKV